MKTILILEDEADIRELISISLSNTQMKCELCSHVADACGLLRRMKPDFVLTDLKLPDGSGLDLLRLSRTLYPDVPIAVITAFADTDSAIEALKLGAVDYLKKPIDTKVLRALIKENLASTKPPAGAEIGQDSDSDSDSELNQITAALEANRWNKRAAAETLGLSYRQLRYRVSKLGLDKK